jgi:SAM-dependent methyltransferase
VGEHPYDAGAVISLPAARWMASRVRSGPVLEIAVIQGAAANTIAQSGLSVFSANPGQRTVSLPAGGTQSYVPAMGTSRELEIGSLSDLPFPDGTFGGVLSHVSALLEHDLDASLDELARVTADDGLLVVVGDDGREENERAHSVDLHNVEALLARRFPCTRVLSQTDWLISAIGAQDWDGPALDQELSRVAGHVRKDAFVAAGASPDIFDCGATSFTEAIDIQSLSRMWTQAVRSARVLESRALKAENLAADRKHLIKELYLSEQALAEAFDVRKRLESMVSTAAEQQRKLALVTDELDATRSRLQAALTNVERGHAEIARLLKASEDAHLQVLAMKNSTSWRITHPLRALTARLKLTTPPG